MSDGLLSRTDPEATHTGHARATSRLGYNAHYYVVVDGGGKARVILSALLVPADVKDNLRGRGPRRPAQVAALQPPTRPPLHLDRQRHGGHRRSLARYRGVFQHAASFCKFALM